MHDCNARRQQPGGLLPPVLKTSNAVLVGMGDPRQTIDALYHTHDQNLTLLQQSLVPLESLFVLLLHVNDQFHGLRQRLVAFGQLIETLVDVHLTKQYI